MPDMSGVGRRRLKMKRFPATKDIASLKGGFEMLSRPSTYYLGLALLLSATANFALMSRLRPESRQKRGSAFLAGSQMPSIGLLDLQGRTHPLREDEFLALIYSPTCGACDRSFSNYDRLVADTQKKALYLSVARATETTNQAKERGVTGSTFIIPESTLRELEIPVVPLTIFVKGGRIRAAHTGLLSDEVLDLFRCVCAQ